jgi:prepilin peptidase CpaA
MAAVGALVSFPGIIHVFLYTAIFGGVLAMFAAARHRVTLEALSNVVSLFIPRRFDRLFARKTSADSRKSVGAIPYGLAIGLGTFTYLLFGAIL